MRTLLHDNFAVAPAPLLLPHRNDFPSAPVSHTNHWSTQMIVHDPSIPLGALSLRGTLPTPTWLFHFQGRPHRSHPHRKKYYSVTTAVLLIPSNQYYIETLGNAKQFSLIDPLHPLLIQILPVARIYFEHLFFLNNDNLLSLTASGFPPLLPPHTPSSSRQLALFSCYLSSLALPPTSRVVSSPLQSPGTIIFLCHSAFREHKQIPLPSLPYRAWT